MLPPAIIEKMRREKEEYERPALELPLYRPDIIEDNNPDEDEEKTESCPVIIIDLV